MFALTSVAATTPAARRFSVGHGSSAQGRPVQRSTLVVAAAPRQPERREYGAPAGAFADGARKALAAALLSALLVAGGWHVWDVVSSTGSGPGFQGPAAV